MNVKSQEIKKFLHEESFREESSRIVSYVTLPLHLMTTWFVLLSTSEWKIMMSLSFRSIIDPLNAKFTEDFIVKSTGLSAPTVEKILPLLLQKGLLDVETDGTNILYTVNFETIEKSVK